MCIRDRPLPPTSMQVAGNPLPIHWHTVSKACGQQLTTASIWTCLLYTSIPYEEFTDNETLEKLVRELNAGVAYVALGVLDDFVNCGRSNSLFPLTFATSCCGIEFMALGACLLYTSRNTPRYFRKIFPLIAISVSNTRCRCYPKSPIRINCNFSRPLHKSRCRLCLFLSCRLFRVEQIAIRTASGKNHYAHNSQNLSLINISNSNGRVLSGDWSRARI